MRVAVFLDRYRPEDGGAFTMQADIFQALCRTAAKGKHQFVVVSLPSAEIENAAKTAGMEWLAYSGPGLFEKISSFLVRTFPSLKKGRLGQNSLDSLLRNEGVELIWFVSPRAFETNLPYLTIVLDLQHRKQPWFPELRDRAEWETRERLLVPFLRKATGIVVGTEAGRREVSDFFRVPVERVYILPHPTPAYALNAAHMGNLPAGLEPGYLFYPAQFWAHKNHVNLLLALKQLRDEGKTIRLVLTGSDYGNLAHIRQTISDLELQNQVNVLGFVSTQEMIALYQNALALTYVSFFGPENLPPLEAFALGCPVIAARVDGAEEQVGESALLVDPAKPEEIASAIRRVHEDASLRNELIEKGKARATNWTADHFIQGVLKIIDDFAPIRRNWR